MTTQYQLITKHDLALLLVNILIDQQRFERGILKGILPSEHIFTEIVNALEKYQISSVCDEKKRSIELYPEWAAVYPSLEIMLSYPANLSKVPEQFTLLDLGYTHGVNHSQPAIVVQYFAACRLSQLLVSIADMVNDGSQRLIFLQSHDCKLEVNLNYSANDLIELKELTEFDNSFVNSELHKEQKRAIIRTVLLELFKGKKSITLGQMFAVFHNFMERLKNSYTMYVSEFSFEKVKAEVEKDNLDSTLKLNKTLSDIQNQLLAMPVALVLVGGQMLSESSFTMKNLVIWLGSLVFAWLMDILILNQCHAVQAIEEEVRLRKAKVDARPADIADKFSNGFKDLSNRAKTLTRTLRLLSIGVGFSIIFSTMLLLWFSYPQLRAW